MNRRSYIFGLCLCIIFAIIIVIAGLEISKLQRGDIIVNGADTTAQTYHIGDMIAQTKSDRYFFHGFDTGLSTYNVLLIGHQTIWIQGSVWSSQYSAMANIKIPIHKGDIIQIGDSNYKVIEYEYAYITLQLT